MTRITITSQKKNTTMPGIAYPATDLALATGASYPDLSGLFRDARLLRNEERRTKMGKSPHAAGFARPAFSEPGRAARRRPADRGARDA